MLVIPRPGEKPVVLASGFQSVGGICLDLAGTLPPPGRVRQFVDSKNPKKREKLIDMLLDSPEYADFWTLKWSDVLRSNRKTIQIKGIHVFQSWLKGHITNDIGFDVVVKELLTGSGSTFAAYELGMERVLEASRTRGYIAV